MQDTANRKGTEDKFRSLLEAAPDAVVVVDESGSLSIINPQTEKLFGYNRSEILGKPLEILIPERFRAKHPEHRAEYFVQPQTRPMGTGLELFGRRRDGTEFPVEISLSPLQTEEGLLVIATVRDLTERKEAEHKIRKLNADLQERAIQLETTVKELEAFSYSVSHDLRSPLRSIDGFSQALLEDYADQLPEQGQNYLKRVRAAAQRMAELIDDLLNLSKVTRAPMKLTPVDLSQLAERIAAELQRTQPERQVSFNITPNMKARGDLSLIQAVLENLLNNAWKYSSKRDRAQIDFGSKYENSETIYFVRDNGAGFDMAYAGKLFGAFQRLHAMTEFPGTGIGLATVQRIIHRHGGRVSAEGAVNQGATFFFTLPALEHAKPEPVPQEKDSLARRVREII